MSSGTQTGYEDSAFFWSDMFHYRKTYQFARRLYANALKADVDIAHGGHEQGREAGRRAQPGAQAAGVRARLDEPLRDGRRGAPVHQREVRRPVPDALAAPPRHREPHGRAASTGMRHPPGTTYGLARHVGAALPARVPQEPHLAGPHDARRRAAVRLLPGLVARTRCTRRARPPTSTPCGGSCSTRTPSRCPSTSASCCSRRCRTCTRARPTRWARAILAWDPGRNTGTGGRPTVAGAPEHVRHRLRVREVHLELRARAAPADAAAGHRRPRHPAAARASPPTATIDLAGARPITFLDILLAILAYALWLAQLLTWIATVLPTMLARARRRGRCASCCTSCCSCRRGTCTCSAASRW